MAIDYSQFTDAAAIAVRMNQRTTADGKLRLDVQIMAGEDCIGSMVMIRESIKKLLDKLAGGINPVYVEEVSKGEPGYNESIEDYYQRTIGSGATYDAHKVN